MHVYLCCRTKFQHNVYILNAAPDCGPVTLLAPLSPALPLKLKTTRVCPEEKREKKFFCYWLSLAPITVERRKADHLVASQSESCGREPRIVQPVLFIKHTPPN